MKTRKRVFQCKQPPHMAPVSPSLKPSSGRLTQPLPHSHCGDQQGKPPGHQQQGNGARSRQDQTGLQKHRVLTPVCSTQSTGAGLLLGWSCTVLPALPHHLVPLPFSPCSFLSPLLSALLPLPCILFVLALLPFPADEAVRIWDEDQDEGPHRAWHHIRTSLWWATRKVQAPCHLPSPDPHPESLCCEWQWSSSWQPKS